MMMQLCWIHYFIDPILFSAQLNLQLTSTTVPIFIPSFIKHKYKSFGLHDFPSDPPALFRD